MSKNKAHGKDAHADCDVCAATRHFHCDGCMEEGRDIAAQVVEELLGAMAEFWDSGALRLPPQEMPQVRLGIAAGLFALCADYALALGLTEAEVKASQSLSVVVVTDLEHRRAAMGEEHEPDRPVVVLYPPHGEPS